MAFLVDTNLCSKIPSSRTLETKWVELSNSLRQEGHRYVICPLVLIELLIGLFTPEPKFFESDLHRFLFLAGESKSEVLPFPGAFLLRTVLNAPSLATKLGPEDFQTSAVLFS